MKNFSLLDYLTYQLNLNCISELHFIENIKKAKLNYLLKEEISLDDFQEKDWLDACEYLSGERQITKGEARQCILGYLSRQTYDGLKSGESLIRSGYICREAKI